MPAMVAVLISGCAGCAKEPRLPRTRDEIIQESLSLPALYLTEKTRQRVIAPESEGVLMVDKKSGEIAWRALVCTAPNCPGKGLRGEPYICSENDLSYFVKPDGSLGYDPKRATLDPAKIGMCQQCNAVRKTATETQQERQQYTQWVQNYILPESLARKKQLEGELKQRIQYERRHRIVRPESQSKVAMPRP